MAINLLHTGKSNLEVFSEVLLELAKNNREILAVTSDSRGSGKLISFAETLPEQIVEVGIAEQNLVGVSAGLASAGKKTFAVSPASFLTTRALEQIKNDVAYSNQPVILVGISAGVSYGALGSTHHSIHDIAVLRAIHNIRIIIPADNFETRQAVIALATSNTPVYLKLGKKVMPDLPRLKQRFQIGKASTIKEGNDLVFIACGETVTPACEAANLLEKNGISAKVISMHTIKPLDDSAILNAAQKCRAVITVEEHSVHGGLGEACASLLMRNNLQVPFEIIGFPDEETKVGSQAEIFSHYGISGEGLKKTALKLMKALCFFVLFTFLFGCTDKKSSDDSQKIAVVISTLNNPWFVVLGNSAAERAIELGYETHIFNSQNDPAKEAEHFDNIIAMGYDAILLNPTDADGSVLNVKRARQAGIPSFCMDREINSRDAATTQLLSDSFTGCVKLGEYFVRQLNKKGNYVEILGLSGDNNTWNRSRGFHSVVDEFPQIHMLAQQSADFDRNKAMDVMETIMQANPDIDAVFCGNDAMAMGAYQAILASGKTDEIKVFGFDGADDVIQGIVEGKITATVMQFPVEMSRISAELAHEYIMGNRNFTNKTPVEVILITAENASEYLWKK